MWRERLDGLGISDVLSAVFRDQYGCWGFLDLWRRDAPFRADEMTAIDRALAAITGLLRGAQAGGFSAADAMPAQAGPTSRGPGVLVLSPALEIRAQTPQTQAWLATLVPPSDGSIPVPAAAYNVAAQLLAVEAGVDQHPALARVSLGRGSWLTLRADRVSGAAPVEERDLRDIMVTMETSTPSERREVFSRAWIVGQGA